MKEVVRRSKLVEGRPHTAALGTDPHGTVNYIRGFLARSHPRSCVRRGGEGKKKESLRGYR